jgi:hypothetical protein
MVSCSNNQSDAGKRDGGMEGLEGKVNPILHTWFRDSCFTCDGSPTIQVFPLNFYTGMVI